MHIKLTQIFAKCLFWTLSWNPKFVPKLWPHPTACRLFVSVALFRSLKIERPSRQCNLFKQKWVHELKISSFAIVIYNHKSHTANERPRADLFRVFNSKRQTSQWKSARFPPQAQTRKPQAHLQFSQRPDQTTTLATNPGKLCVGDSFVHHSTRFLQTVSEIQTKFLHIPQKCCTPEHDKTRFCSVRPHAFSCCTEWMCTFQSGPPITNTNTI